MSDQPVLKRQSYGKSQVRVSRIERRGERHEFIELTVWAELAGDFDASYTEADNSKIVATDTVKNTVYVLAKRHGIASAEAFCQRLATHFLETYAHVESVDIRAVETPWTRMTLGREEHPHAFLGGSSERNNCDLVATRSATTMHSGLSGLQVLKTTESGFTDFLQDEYTTLVAT
jgi:urate oxidase